MKGKANQRRQQRTARARDPAEPGYVSLSERIATQITDEIVSGQSMPGTHLNEQTLAEQFGVSRTPIREAIRRLVAHNLVEIIPRRGAFVRNLPVDELIQLFEFMSELEGICARLSARRMTKADKDHLERVHRSYQKYVGRKDTNAYFDNSNEFHRLVYLGAKNDVLARTTSDMYHRLTPYRRRQLEMHGRTEDSYEEHEAVLAAIQAGDGEAAEQAMRAHTGIVIDNVMALVSAMQKDASAG